MKNLLLLLSILVISLNSIGQTINTNNSEPRFKVDMTLDDIKRVDGNETCILPKDIPFDNLYGSTPTSYQVENCKYLYFWRHGHVIEKILESKLAIQEYRKMELENAAWEKQKREESLRLLGPTTSLKSKIDIVSQVLNYSEGCDDKGCSDNSSWVVRDSKNCVYDFVDLSNGIIYETIRLNEFDPRDIKVGSKNYTNSFVTSEVQSFGKQNYRIFKNNPTTTVYQVVEYRGESLFKSTGIDAARLKRGWSLIYSKHFSGSKKSF